MQYKNQRRVIIPRVLCVNRCPLDILWSFILRMLWCVFGGDLTRDLTWRSAHVLDWVPITYIKRVVPRDLDQTFDHRSSGVLCSALCRSNILFHN